MSDLIERLNDAWRKLYGDGDEHDVCDTIAEAATVAFAVAKMRDVLKEAARICKDLDDEALAKEGRLACGAECAAAIADLAARMNVPFERA